MQHTTHNKQQVSGPDLGKQIVFVCCFLFDVSLLVGACRSLRVECPLIIARRCLVAGVCCPVFVARCVLCVVGCVLRVDCCVCYVPRATLVVCWLSCVV